MTETHGSKDTHERPRNDRVEGRREVEGDDWWGTDRLDAIGWAAIFVWGAVVVLATNTDFSDDFSWWDGWGVFFLGAGAIVLVEAAARLLIPEYRSKLSWTFVWGVIFVSIGLGTLSSSAWLAMALIAIAIAILVGAFRRAG